LTLFGQQLIGTSNSLLRHDRRYVKLFSIPEILLITKGATMGEAIKRDKPRIRFEDWELVGDKLYGLVYNHPDLEDGVPVGLAAQGVTLPTYLRDPYGSEAEPSLPLQAGVELETPRLHYRLGHAMLVPPIPVYR
jgi:hypothetical protein